MEYTPCDFLGFAVCTAASYVGKCLTKAAVDDMFVDRIVIVRYFCEWWNCGLEDVKGGRGKQL